MSPNSKRILIVFHNPNPPEQTRVTILQHLRALEYSDVKHEFVYYNAYEATPGGIIDSKIGYIPSRLQNISFDAIILHYTFLSFCTLGLLFYSWKRKFDWIRDLDGLKVAMPQDEGDFPELLDEWLFDLGVSVIFSVHYTPEGPLYRIMRDHATIYPCLPGYIDEATAQRYEGRLLPICKRPKDVVYRARRLPYRFGTAGKLKYAVADVFAPRAKALGFNVDISTRYEDAVFGDDWFDFLASSKAVLGTPGGWSAVDWRGELRAQISAILREDPSLTFDQIDVRMEKGWDDYQFFTVTPRHFEAVITKTCQVLVEGDYREVLEADRHFIPLRRDFSNLEQVLAKLRDSRYVQDMVDCAYEEIYLTGQYTYGAFAKRVQQILDAQLSLEQGAEEVMSEEKGADKAIEALERQLIAERHQNALMQACLPDMAEQVAEQVVNALVRRAKGRIKRLLPLVGVLALAIIVALVLYWIW